MMLLTKPKGLALGLAVVFAAPFCPVFGNPQNGTIRSGEGEILDSESSELLINQFSDKLTLDWESFSISPGEITRFLQPGANSAALNRVLSGDPSHIFGSLEANGNIWLINPNGILIGPGGSVRANGFVGSTLDVTDGDFLNGGDARFFGNSAALVENLGQIEALGGDIFLFARQVRNAGSLRAPQGTVGLAGGSQIVIAEQGEERIHIIPEGQNGAVENSGVIEAATAELKAAGGNAYALAINNSGVVRGTEIQQRGGRIFLTAGGSGGIVNTGTLSAKKADSGGEITVTGGGAVNLAGMVEARSETGPGGSIQVSGAAVNVMPEGRVDVSGTEGGKIALAGSESVSVLGRIAAGGTDGDGGEVHLQGAEVEIGGYVEARSENAAGGAVNVNATALNLMPESRVSVAGAQGGEVALVGTESVTIDGRVSASGDPGNGGSLRIQGEEIAIGGFLDARSAEEAGGTIEVNGSSLTVLAQGRLDVSGEEGGLIALAGLENIDVQGLVLANGASGSGGRIQIDGGDGAEVEISGTLEARSENGTGGAIQVNGHSVTLLSTGRIDASGADGGQVGLEAADSAQIHGLVAADGTAGNGGVVHVSAQDVVAGPGAQIQARGTAGNGGRIQIQGADSVDFQGTALAGSRDGAGGAVWMTARNVSLNGHAFVDASGGGAGGEILIGGGRQGRDSRVANAQNTSVGAGVTLTANSNAAGNGGTIVLWADGATHFHGTIQNRGAGGGAGGFTEVSGLQHLSFNGHVDTGGGELLLDPFDYSIGFADATAIVAALNGGTNVTIDTAASPTGAGVTGVATGGAPGSISVISDINWNSTANLTFLAGDDLFLDANILNLNPAGGDLNLAAGWDELTAFDAAAFSAADLSTTTLFGNTQGDVFIATNAFLPVSVGSRAGVTRVFTEDLLIQGENFVDAQLGFLALDGGAAFATDGDILVRSTGGVTVEVDSAVPNFGHAQIGHIGNGPNAIGTSDGTSNGNITIEALGDVLVNANGAAIGAARIGHGGRDVEATVGGAINITTPGDVSVVAGANSMGDYSAQIGGGGPDFAGTATTDITINAANATISVANTFGDSAHIGNGGPGATGSFQGTIDVTLGNNLTITGGAAPNFAHLGHGNTPGDNDTGATVAGNVNVRAGNNIAVTQGTIGNFLDPTGTNLTGNTFIGVGQNNYTAGGTGTITADVNSTFSSGQNGELRFYIPNNAGYQIAAGASLNGVAAPAPGTDPLPNLQGQFTFGAGPYGGNFSFYHAPVPPPPPPPACSNADAYTHTASNADARACADPYTAPAPAPTPDPPPPPPMEPAPPPGPRVALTPDPEPEPGT